MTVADVVAVVVVDVGDEVVDCRCYCSISDLRTSVAAVGDVARLVVVADWSVQASDSSTTRV